ATPMTRMAMWAYLVQAEAQTQPFPAIPAARPGGVRGKTREQRPGRPDQRDEKTVSTGQDAASRDEVASQQNNGQAAVNKPQLHGTKGLARPPPQSPPWAPVPSPAPAPPKAAPEPVSPKPASPHPVPPEPVPPQPVPAPPKLEPPRLGPPK